MSTSGPTASARAIATRCRCPPLSSRGCFFATLERQVDELEEPGDEAISVRRLRSVVDAAGLENGGADPESRIE